MTFAISDNLFSRGYGPLRGAEGDLAKPGRAGPPGGARRGVAESVNFMDKIRALYQEFSQGSSESAGRRDLDAIHRSVEAGPAGASYGEASTSSPSLEGSPSSLETSELHCDDLSGVESFSRSIAPEFVRELRAATPLGVDLSADVFARICTFVNKQRANWEASGQIQQVEFEGQFIMYTPTMQAAMHNAEGQEFHRKGIVTMLIAVNVAKGATKILDVEVKIPDYRRHFYGHVQLVANLRVTRGSQEETALLERIEKSHFYANFYGLKPNVLTPKLYSIDQGEHHSYSIKMEYCRKGTLYQFLRPENYRFDRLIPYVKETAKSLSALHDEGFVHLDVKPENVFIDEDSILLGDFGLSLSIGERLTWTRGTYPFLPPEIPKISKFHKVSADPKMDVWSLGATLYYSLFNSTVNEGLGLKKEKDFLSWLKKSSFSSIQNRLDAHMKKLREQLHTEDARELRLLDLLEKMLVADPAKRISMREVINHLSICENM